MNKKAQKIEYCLEIAQSHDGSLGYVNSILRSLAVRGIRIVKFQMHLPEFESTLNEPFRVELIGQDESRFDYWRRTGFSYTQWEKISMWCKEYGLEFLCTPLSCEAVDALTSLGVKRFKIASGDANNAQLIDYVRSKNKPIIISTGLSSDSEIEELVSRFPEPFPLTILYCVTKYPASVSDINFRAISNLKKKFPHVQVGYSDHTGNPLVAIAASHYGASFIEQHVVFSKEQYGPDTTSSVDLDDARLVQSYLNLLPKTYNPNSRISEELSKGRTKSVFSRGLALKTSLKKGEIVEEINLTSACFICL
jgi:N,N'-diacetyllegionaminate synthase